MEKGNFCDQREDQFVMVASEVESAASTGLLGALSMNVYAPNFRAQTYLRCSETAIWGIGRVYRLKRELLELIVG